MPLDRKLIRDAQEAYRQWNEVELRERLRSAGQITPEESWRRYVELWEFCQKIAPQQSDWQQTQKIADISQYYDRVRKLEAWRQKHGKRA